MHDWYEFRFKKKLRRRMAGAAAAFIRGGRRLRKAIGLSPGRDFVTTRYGVRMRANWDDATFHCCHFGVYGRVLADCLAQQNTDFLFIDIGANQGLYALLAARNPHCQRVVALEPVPDTFELLRQNVAANGVAARVELLQAALAERAGTARIAMRAGHSGGATLAHQTNAQHRAHRQTVRLIDMAELDRHIPAGPQLLVKVDVEGYENVVLAELMRSAHASRIVAVFYEVDTRWSSADGLRAVLAAAGFTSFTRHGPLRHHDVMATRAVSTSACMLPPRGGEARAGA